jgi:hypothetical protein
MLTSPAVSAFHPSAEDNARTPDFQTGKIDLSCMLPQPAV